MLSTLTVNWFGRTLHSSSIWHSQTSVNSRFLYTYSTVKYIHVDLKNKRFSKLLYQLMPWSQQIVRFFVEEDLLKSCRGSVVQNVKKLFRVVTLATTCSRWFHDCLTTKKNVIVLSWVCRKSVMRQSCDNLELFGAMFLGFHVMGCACYCRATIVRLSHNSRGSLARLTPNY